jgi:nucleoside-diphosphate-sugar epimerase
MTDFLALMDLAVAEGAPIGVYNVSTGEGHSIKEVFDEVAGYLGVKLAEPVPIVPPGADDVKAMVLDPSATEKAFGWKARIGFRETIRSQLDWYRRHGVSDVYTHLAAAGAGACVRKG